MFTILRQKRGSKPRPPPPLSQRPADERCGSGPILAAFGGGIQRAMSTAAGSFWFMRGNAGEDARPEAIPAARHVG